MPIKHQPALRYIALAFTLGAPLAPLPAEEVMIVLKSGSVMRGEIVSEGSAFYKMNCNGAIVNVFKAIIVSIDGKPYGTQAEAPLSPPAQQPATADVPTPAPAPVPGPMSAAPASDIPLSTNAVTPAPPAPVDAPPSAPIAAGEHTIVLRNGTSFKGIATKETPRFISFNINGAIVNVLRTMIVSLDGKPFDEVTTATPSASTPVVTPAAPAFVSREAPAPMPSAVQPTPITTIPTVDSVKTKATANAPAATTVTTYGQHSSLSPRIKSVSGDSTWNTSTSGGATTKPQPPSPEVQTQIKRLTAQERQKQIQGALQLKALGPKAASAIPQLIELLANDNSLPSAHGRKKKNEPVPPAITPAGAAVEALAAIGEAAVPPLMNALAIHNPVVRLNAIKALDQLSDPRSVEGLLACIKDSSSAVRAQASSALGNIRDPRAIPLLITLMGEDTSEVVRNAVQTALTNLTDIPSLIATLRNPRQVVRDNVAYLLFLMTAKDFRKDPLQWENWWKQQEK